MADDLDEDLFQLLDISPTASDQDVKKAYRRKALTCHPDKCDSPDAVALFGKYKKAAEVLLDKEARKSYERILKARKERQERDNSLDSTRKKFKSNLEAREKAYDHGVQRELDEKAKLAAEIERLRKEGSSVLEMENEKIKRLIAEERTRVSANQVPDGVRNSGFQVKISWKNSPKNFNEKEIEGKMKIFGNILSSFLSTKKRKGIVEYVERSAAEAALSSRLLNDFKLTPFFDISSSTVTQGCSTQSTHPLHVMPSSFGTLDFEKDLLQQLKRKAEESQNGS